MEIVAPALQKKYHKITGISRGNSFNASSASDPPTPTPTPTLNASTSKSSTSTTLAPKYPVQAQPQRDDNTLKMAKIENLTEPNTLNTQPNVRIKGMSSLKQKAQQVIQSARQSETVLPLPSRNAFSSNQPLNLTSDSNATVCSVTENLNKRPQGLPFVTSSTSSGVPITQPLVIETTSQPSSHQNHHPQNPERSIIKSLLLNSRGLAVPTTGEGEDAIYTCPLCKISFRSADNLQNHTKNYCQGTPPMCTQSSGQNRNNSPHSAPISPVGSPSHKYFRSNSFNINLPEKYSPNTLAKLASSSLRHHRTPLSLAKLAAERTGSYFSKSSPGSSRGRPENINIGANIGHGSSGIANSNPSGSGHISMQSVSSQCVQITKQLIDALPSPGPLLGKTRLVDTYNVANENKREDAIVSNYAMPAIPLNSESVSNDQESSSKNARYNETLSSPNRKRQRRDSYTHSPPLKNAIMSNELLLSQKNPRLLQMCGGDLKIFERKGDTTPKFGSSGGSIISISPDRLSESSPIGLRAGLLSGGSIIETPSKKTPSSVSPSRQTPERLTPHSALTIDPHFTLNGGSQSHLIFQYPPVNPITAVNPLTLPLLNTNEPKKILYGDRIIPYVQGMPGPNSLPIVNQMRSPSPVRKKIMPSSPVAIRPVPNQQSSMHSTYLITNKSAFPLHANSPKLSPKAFSDVIGRPSINSNYNNQAFHYREYMAPIWSPALTPKITDANKKSFNFTRIADNLSPSKTPMNSSDSTTTTMANTELKCFNFETLIPKPEVLMRTNKYRASGKVSPLHIDVVSVPTLVVPATSLTSTLSSSSQSPMTSRLSPNAEQTSEIALKQTTKPTKFLRPTTLPLKPGTFSPKRHHGITPTANTLPLISPDTPRPSKSCIQLYLNGHAYTYLGLKCSTKPFYCTVNRPQMVHFINQSKQPISCYSNWQICEESSPLGLTPKELMSAYDSRQRLQQYRRFGKYTIANKTSRCTTLHSQSLICTAVDTRSPQAAAAGEMVQSNKKGAAFAKPTESLRILGMHTASSTTDSSTELSLNSDSGYHTGSTSATSLSMVSTTPTVPGGYESNEHYTYVRGRGRGRYVCSECGIRCKKPSMLKKHIRTHTDVRPYTCQHCSFR